jgi:aspartyl-tRNA(Asn)/glutamyl-tRNA(Gln) amidotransferase subunit B
MLDLADKGAIDRPTVKVVLDDMLHTGQVASEIIRKKKLSQISDADETREVVKQIIANNSEAVLDYRLSKQQALIFITG